MTTIDEWAAAWRIPIAAMADLRIRMAVLDPDPTTKPGRSEAAVSSELRKEASSKGFPLWRNSVGALKPEGSDRPVRFGLCNDTHDLNAVCASADFVACVPELITPAHVGRTFGRFTSVEAKKEGWRYTGKDNEVAQMNWAARVISLGGRAIITDRVGRL